MNAARNAILAFILCWAVAAVAEVAVPPLTGRVVDQTSTLNRDQVATLERTLKDFEEHKGSQLAVLIVPTTKPETIEQYSLRVAEQWKIGRKKIDDGAILVVAKDDRALRIEVGYGLEGALPDVTAKRIIDEIITPKFRSGDFAGGISGGVDRIIRVVDGEPLPAPVKPRQNSDLLNNIDPLNPFLIFGVFIVGAILRTTLGRLVGSAATGGVVGLLAWLLIGSLALSAISAVIAFILTMFGESIASANGGSGNWSGGGGSYSRRSSSNGGFRGGGGGFGGGGSSGRW